MILCVVMLICAIAAAGWAPVYSKTKLSVTLTPWCDNSMRVRIAPSTMPASTQAAQAALAKSLAAKNLTDLAGALTTASCRPGEPTVTQSGETIKSSHGNLAADVTADGSISFSRKDTGELLIKAVPAFSINGGVSTGDASKWKTRPDQAASTCSASEYTGSTGAFDSAAECLASVISSGERANYALWRGNDNKGC